MLHDKILNINLYMNRKGKFNIFLQEFKRSLMFLLAVCSKSEALCFHKKSLLSSIAIYECYNHNILNSSTFSTSYYIYIYNIANLWTKQFFCLYLTMSIFKEILPLVLYLLHGPLPNNFLKLHNITL